MDAKSEETAQAYKSYFTWYPVRALRIWFSENRDWPLETRLIHRAEMVTQPRGFVGFYCMVFVTKVVQTPEVGLNTS